jgi:hypothetical protein
MGSNRGLSTVEAIIGGYFVSNLALLRYQSANIQVMLLASAEPDRVKPSISISNLTSLNQTGLRRVVTC